jgi:hypothetical protein
MRTSTYSWLALITFFVAVFIYAYNTSLIIIRSPQNPFSLITNGTQSRTKKITCYAWQRGQWHTEEKEVVMIDDNLDLSCFNSVSTWLSYSNEESARHTTLETACVTTSGLALISFEDHPFTKEMAIIDKLYWVEGLLKTIRESGIKIQEVQFLVQEKPLLDTHLDFSIPWPIIGFLKQ